MKILAFMASGTEDSELIGTLSLLQRAKIDRLLISVEDSLTLKGSHGNTIVCDSLLSSYSVKQLLDYDGLFIPGGKRGVDTMKNTPKLLELIKEYSKRGKPITSICAGPTVLSRAGIMEGVSFTCYDGFEKEIPEGCYVVKSPVVRDKNIITARSVAYVSEFGLDIIKYLLSDSEYDRVKHSILKED